MYQWPCIALLETGGASLLLLNCSAHVDKPRTHMSTLDMCCLKWQSSYTNTSLLTFLYTNMHWLPSMDNNSLSWWSTRLDRGVVKILSTPVLIHDIHDLAASDIHDARHRFKPKWIQQCPMITNNQQLWSTTWIKKMTWQGTAELPTGKNVPRRDYEWFCTYMRLCTSL